MKNYSRQRETVLKVLSSTTSHPTVNWIYEQAKAEIPNISLGTVYRNLTALAQAGDILEIDVGDGFQHFDADTTPHMHFRCRLCGRIFDCKTPSTNLKNYVEKTLGCHVQQEALQFEGVCKDCMSDKK